MKGVKHYLRDGTVWTGKHTSTVTETYDGG